jgi:hypothetical protein
MITRLLTRNAVVAAFPGIVTYSSRNLYVSLHGTPGPGVSAYDEKTNPQAYGMVLTGRMLLMILAYSEPSGEL